MAGQSGKAEVEGGRLETGDGTEEEVGSEQEVEDHPEGERARTGDREFEIAAIVDVAGEVRVCQIVVEGKETDTRCDTDVDDYA